MLHVRSGSHLAVDENFLGADLQPPSPGRPTMRLTKSTSLSCGRLASKLFVRDAFEHDDIAALRLVHGDQELVGKGQLDAVMKLAHQELVANLQGLQHGARGDFEGLHDKGG